MGSVTVGTGHSAGVPVAAGSRSGGFGKQRGLYERTPRSAHASHPELKAEAPGVESPSVTYTPVNGRAGTPLVAPVVRPIGAPSL